MSRSGVPREELSFITYVKDLIYTCIPKCKVSSIVLQLNIGRLDLNQKTEYSFYLGLFQKVSVVISLYYYYFFRQLRMKCLKKYAQPIAKKPILPTCILRLELESVLT